MASAAAHFTFKPYEVVIGTGNRQTVLTGFLLGGPVEELAVVNIDERGNRRLHIYAFGDSSWVPKLDATLRPDVTFVDVANIGGRDRLITYEPGRLNWFDPESGAERTLVAVTSNFDPPRNGEIPHVDVTRDLNDDGASDLVVPDVDGFWVFIQTKAGEFADPLKIGPSPELAGIYGADGYRYQPWSQSRVHKIDYNRDGRSDLAFWNLDHFEVHVQDENGLFSPTARTFKTDVAFDSDQIFSLAGGDRQGRALHAVTDLNGDGVADLGVLSLEGKSISNKRSTYEVHFGEPTPDGDISFPQRADIVFRSEGRIQLGMDRHDFDGDGRIDLMFTTIEVRYLEGSLWKSIKGFMGDDVYLHLEFYRMDGGRFSDAPDATRRIALDGPPSHREPGWVPLELVLQGPTHESRKMRTGWPRAFNCTLLIGDVNGDGLSDLIIGSHPRSLDVFVGVPGPDLFAQRPRVVAVDVPNDAEYTWLVDLDKDGSLDILMHHPFTLRDAHGGPKRPPGTEPHRVTTLFAR